VEEGLCTLTSLKQFYMNYTSFTTFYKRHQATPSTPLDRGAS